MPSAAKRRTRINGPAINRFEYYTNKTPHCWIWTGRLFPNGYGCISVNGREVLAHRWSYRQFVGPIPEGQQIDHICRNRSCVKPAHLRLANNKQNNEHHGIRSDNTTGYRGVSFHKKLGKYTAKVQHHGKTHYAGSYETAELAAEAARQLRLRLFTHNEYDRKGG